MGALLLTFATAITAGFFVYQFMFSLTEKMKTAFPTESLQLESKEINTTCITLLVRNVAPADVQITEVYVNGKAYNLSENIVVSPSNVAVIHLQGAYIYGKTYAVQIASSMGSPLSLEVEYD